MMDMNCMNSKSGILIFVLVGIVMLSAITSNNYKDKVYADRFHGPVGVDVDSKGNVFVTEPVEERIQKFNNTGTFIRKWGSQGLGDGQFQYPVGIAIDSSGNVFIADAHRSNVQKFTNTGKFIRKWGSLGSGDGQFNNEALGIGIDSKGNVFVADTLNGRIQKFTNTGNFVKKWGLHGSHGPIDVAVDPSGNVFVTAGNIQNLLITVNSLENGEKKVRAMANSIIHMVSQ
jgi:tripartite motif-containing protein 71